MNEKTPARFFLGANSKNGFYSLYDSYTDPAAGDFLWVIKGSPGCGKSSFMKHIGAAAEREGIPAEYILCSGDPDSLDAVWFPTLHTGYVDGTAPHVMEAVYPGAASLYLDLGAFLDAGALAAHLDEIVDLNRRYRAYYAAAYQQLAAGAALLPKNLPGLFGEAEKEKMEKKLAGLLARELPRRVQPGHVSRRFLSAVSCKGRVFLEETLTGLCERVCVLDNELGLAHFYLERLAAAAVSRGCSVIVCPDPLEPEKADALLLPEEGLGFAAADTAHAFALTPWRHVRLDALPDRETVSALRPELRRRRKESRLLLSAAEDSLRSAKSLHDSLEAVYHPHVDFDGVFALADDHISWLLGV